MASVNKERIETADSDKQRILRGAVIDGLSGCWNWKLSKQRNGYGQIKFKGKMCRAHRVSYQLFVGEIPDGNEVMHKCDNRSCVNPDHLSCGTHEENMNDLKRRAAKGKAPLIYDWHTVVIEPARPSGECLGGTHASPRQHERRGHWRTCANGKRVWIRHCTVGDASRGTVFKDYKISDGGTAMPANA